MGRERRKINSLIISQLANLNHQNILTKKVDKNEQDTCIKDQMGTNSICSARSEYCRNSSKIIECAQYT